MICPSAVLIGALLSSACSERAQQASPGTDPFENRVGAIVDAMGSSEVLSFSSTEWINPSDASMVFQGRGDQGFMDAVTGCSWFGVWEPSSHNSYFALPSENSDVWKKDPNADVIPDRQIIECVAQNSKTDFVVARSPNIKSGSPSETVDARKFWSETP